MTSSRENSRVALVSLARSAIASALGLESAPVPAAPVLAERRGAFVTLRLGRDLRGCVGRVQADQTVRLVVPRMARAAAFGDPRFRPLASGELARVTIEVSLLTRPVRASRADEVMVGRHGVIVAARGRRGLLLPQVAIEWNWTREELLEHACEKAGLDPGAWRNPATRIEIFTADVFGEEEPPA